MIWQPIETVPKDEQVFVMDKWGVPAIATLRNGQWYNDELTWFAELGFLKYPDVLLSAEEQEKLSLLDTDPTHWMLIPTPPETKE